LEVSLPQDEQFPNNKIKGCIIPWTHLFGAINGEYKICCFSEYWSPVLGNHLDEIDDVWNGDAYKQVRRDFLQGKKIPACEKACYEKERLGSQSHRQNINENYAHFQKLQELTRPDGSIKNYPVYLDVRFGNTCNFRCRMCGPNDSTSWYKEKPSEGGKQFRKPIDKYTDNETFWLNIDKIAPNILEVYFAGGEPFVQDGHYKLLNYMIDNNHAKRISLSYNTNLSYQKYKNHDIRKLWRSFYNVKLWPSCDGYGSRVDYSRKGFSWNKFEANIDYYKEYIQTISAVISIYSISTMPELLLWAKNRDLSVHGTTLIDPSHMSVTCLPIEAKKSINLKFKKFLKSNYHLFNRHELDMIKSWLSYMGAKDDSHLLKLFKSYNTKFDLTRNENFEATFPEYASWYKNI